METLKRTIQNPNLSIITPGGCNAKCKFCFWGYKKEATNYDEILFDTLAKMPNQFDQISITGGEPTSSPYLLYILRNIRILRHKYKKVVLTSNGFQIIEFMNILDGIVDHINISRHSISDDRNYNIFNTHAVPNTNKLKEICESANNYGIDVTLSTVLTDEFKNKKDIIDFIEYAKGVGCSAVFFRKKHGDIYVHELEDLFSNIKYSEYSCGVCRNRFQLINGMKVTWKASVMEPSNELGDEIYEAVFHPNGKLTEDWECNNEIDFLEYNSIKNTNYNSNNLSCGSAGCNIVRESTSGCGRSSRMSC